MSPTLRGLLAVVLAAAVAVPAALWTWPVIGDLAERTAAPPDPERMDLVVVPHAGDEFQALSLVEDDPTSYKVFVLATRGSYRSLDAWVQRFRELGRVDETLPTDLQELGRRGPFPDDYNAVCRAGDRPGRCRAMRSAEVWADDDGRGALVAFDLGADGLSRREVLWAVRTVRWSREALGIEPTLRPGVLVGAAFANRSYGCAGFENPDHLAVHEALYDTDLHFMRQAAPTCADDPDATESAVVSDRSAEVFFGGSTGPRVHRSVAKVDRQGQQRPFHTRQSFWVRFGN